MAVDSRVVMVVVEEESVSVTCSCEGGGSKMCVMGSRVGENDGGTSSGRSAPVVWVRELLA